MEQLVNNMHRPLRQSRHGLGQLCAGVVIAVVNSSAAAAVQSHERIRHTAHDALARQAMGVGKGIRIELNELDTRLRVAARGRAPTAFPPPRSNLSTPAPVEVHGKGDEQWPPLYVRSQVRIRERIVVSLHPTTRGRRAAEQDITTVERVVGGIHTTVRSGVIGTSIKRSIPVNVVLDRIRHQRTLPVRTIEQIRVRNAISRQVTTRMGIRQRCNRCAFVVTLRRCCGA